MSTENADAATANPDPAIANPVPEKVKPKTTVEECVSFFQDYINGDRKDLKTFYKDEDLAKLGERAKTMFGAMIELGCKKETAQWMTVLVLYDIVMLIDDSRSMKTEEGGKRIETLHKTIEEITRVYDYANENGIKSVRFLNGKKGIANIKNRNWKKPFDKIGYTGVTKIGTSLNQKILEKFVWGEPMTKPLLVMIITDGDVEGEREGLLADVIAGCVQKLATDEKRGKQAVSFHFSRVGDDDDARRLLETLDDNAQFGKHVDCLYATGALETLKGGTDREKWTVLPKLLLGAISNLWDEDQHQVKVENPADITVQSEDEEDEDADAGDSGDEDADADAA